MHAQPTASTGPSRTFPFCGCDPLSQASDNNPAQRITAGWSALIVLGVSALMLLTLACVAGWLSFRAQAGYVLAHNGGATDRAEAWAVLLDAATAGVSLLRLHDALTDRPAAATRAVLLACIGGSVAMNVAGVPSHSAGEYFVAAVPPLLYATLLELLLAKVTGMLTGRRALPPRRLTRVAVAMHFPILVWRVWRSGLRRHLPQGAPIAQPCQSWAKPPVAQGVAPEPRNQAAQRNGAPAPEGARNGAAQLRLLEIVPTTQRTAHQGTTSRRPGTRRVAFEAALEGQLRRGDRRVLSFDARTRNSAAYEAAQSLPVPLSPGTARRYLLEALPRLLAAAEAVGAENFAAEQRQS